MHITLAGLHGGPLLFSNWNLKMLVYVEAGKPENPEKTLEVRPELTTNSTHIWHQARIEFRPYWWEASALITASSLLLIHVSHRIFLFYFTGVKLGLFLKRVPSCRSLKVFSSWQGPWQRS